MRHKCDTLDSKIGTSQMLWLLQNTECVSKFSYLKEISQNMSFFTPAPSPYTTEAVQLPVP